MLDASELETVQSIPYEHCLKQFFQQCDLDKDRKLTLDETCRCFAVGKLFI